MITLPFKAIAFDVDDTLSESKQSLDVNMGALLGELSTLVPIAIISGGKLEQLQKQVIGHIAHPNYENFYLFPTGGAAAFTFQESGTLVSLYEHRLSEDEVKLIVKESSRIIEESRLLIGKTLYGEIIEARGSGIAISLLGQEAPPHVKKEFDPDQKKRLSLLPLLQSTLPDFSIKIGGSTTIDISKAGIDKAYGMREFSKLINIPEKDILYVGDALYPGGNDEAVLKTKLRVHAVKNKDETAAFLTSLLHGDTV
jgi:phosphomannomutase